MSAMAKKIINSPALQKSLQTRNREATKTYAELRQTVTDRGILDRSYGYYAWMIVFGFGGFLFAGYLLVITQSPILLVLFSLIFTFFSIQVGGLMHDAGHRAVFATTKANDILGHISCFFLAQSFSYWNFKHNAHHAHPNQEDEDPDVDLPLLSFNRERYLAKRGLAKKLVRYQAYLYYPIGLLVGFSMRIGSYQYFRQQFRWSMYWEIGLFVIGLYAWFVAPFFLFDLPKAILLSVVIHTSMGFYLLNIFAPNHKGMPEIGKGVRLSFFEQQVITSRNIHGHPVTDFVYIGLNYQIEHHLFPNCPRNKLSLLNRHVQRLCRKMKLDYTEVSFVESNKVILRELHDVAKSA